MVSHLITPQSLDQDSGYSGSPSTPLSSPHASIYESHIQSNSSIIFTTKKVVSSIIFTTKKVEGDKFWTRQQVTDSVALRFFESTKHVLLYGPDHKIPGLRVDVDLASKEDTPCVKLQITNEGPTTRNVSLQAPIGSRSLLWGAWDIAEAALEKSWPKGIPSKKPPKDLAYYLDVAKNWTCGEEAPMAQDWAHNVMPYKKSVYQYPGHFNGDWGFFKGASMVLQEYSFSDGNVPSMEYRAILQPNRETFETDFKLHDHYSKPHSERHGSTLTRLDRSGKSWTIYSTGSIMPLNIWTFASSQVILGLDENDCNFQLGIMLPKRYASEWPLTTWTNWCCSGREMLHIQFHLRYLSKGRAPLQDQMPPSTGFCLERGRKEMAAWPGIRENFWIEETRASIGMLTSLGRPARFNMVALADDSGFSIDCLTDRNTWDAMGLKPSDGNDEGVALFQMGVGRLIREWKKGWELCLKQLSFARIKMQDISSATWYEHDIRTQSRERLLLYEQAREMIKDLRKDLESLQRDVALVLKLSRRIIGANWEALHRYHAESEKKLLDQVAQELEVLRCLSELTPLNPYHTCAA